MKFIIKKLIWSYSNNINGDIINKKHVFVIRIRKNIFDIFKKPRYIRISTCNTLSGQRYLVTFTKDPNHATKYKTKEEACARLEDIIHNPNLYEI